jgi:hypothetical protein
VIAEIATAVALAVEVMVANAMEGLAIMAVTGKMAVGVSTEETIVTVVMIAERADVTVVEIATSVDEMVAATAALVEETTVNEVVDARSFAEMIDPAMVIVNARE